jgi:hypothetical protein
MLLSMPAPANTADSRRLTHLISGDSAGKREEIQRKKVYRGAAAAK